MIRANVVSSRPMPKSFRVTIDIDHKDVPLFQSYTNAEFDVGVVMIELRPKAAQVPLNKAPSDLVTQPTQQGRLTPIEEALAKATGVVDPAKPQAWGVDGKLKSDGPEEPQPAPGSVVGAPQPVAVVHAPQPAAEQAKQDAENARVIDVTKQHIAEVREKANTQAGTDPEMPPWMVRTEEPKKAEAAPVAAPVVRKGSPFGRGK